MPIRKSFSFESGLYLGLLEGAPLDGPRLGVAELLPERPRLDEGGEEAGVGLVRRRRHVRRPAKGSRMAALNKAATLPHSSTANFSTPFEIPQRGRNKLVAGGCDVNMRFPENGRSTAPLDFK